jgi:predicted pyridoxine 5'-phosphate oxidase superfamily flavin-nucleotide-binding protein
MVFHDGEISVQERAGVRDIAADVGEGIYESIGEGAQAFLEKRRMVVFGTADRSGSAWASVVIGESGFISVMDGRDLRIAALPDKGDPLLENLATDSHVALFVPDFLASKRIRVNGRGRIEDGVIYVKAQQVYGNCKRYMQERIFLGTRPKLVAADITFSATLSASQSDQIARADTFFIATDHPRDGADVSHKGGSPGFVRSSDDCHLTFPDYNGNSMFNSLGNIAINPCAGLLFIDFDTGRTLQLTGRASIDWDIVRAQNFAGAERVVDFEVAKVIERSCGFALVSKFRQFSRYNP